MQFRHKNSLVRHLCQHTGERPYSCPDCKSTFVSMHRMKDHFKKCRLNPTQQTQQEPQRKPDEQVKSHPTWQGGLLFSGVFNCWIQWQTSTINTFQTLLLGILTQTSTPHQALTVIPVQPAVAAPQQTTIPVMSLLQGLDGKMYLISQPSTTPQHPPTTTTTILIPSQNHTVNQVGLDEEVEKLIGNVLNDQYNLVLTAIMMANTENTEMQIGHCDIQPRKSSFR